MRFIFAGMVFAVFFLVALEAFAFAGEMVKFGKKVGDEITWCFQVDYDSFPQTGWSHFVVNEHNVWITRDAESELDDIYIDGHCYCVFAIVNYGIYAVMDCYHDEPCHDGCLMAYGEMVWYTGCIPYHDGFEQGG